MDIFNKRSTESNKHIKCTHYIHKEIKIQVRNIPSLLLSLPKFKDIVMCKTDGKVSKYLPQYCRMCDQIHLILVSVWWEVLYLMYESLTMEF